MSAAKTLIDENNNTLVFIEVKDYSNALESSLSALSYLQSADFTANNSHSEESTTLDQCMMLRSKAAYDEFSSDHTQQPFIFDQGILLPPTITDLNVITPALIFNAALAHQLLLNDQSTPPATTTIQFQLQKAKRLYELAYGSCERVPSRNELFRFVLINNLAVIERQIGNMEHSERYFQGLMSVYMVFVVAQRSAKKLHYLQDFLSNHLSFYNNNSPAA